MVSSFISYFSLSVNEERERNHFSHNQESMVCSMSYHVIFICNLNKIVYWNGTNHDRASISKSRCLMVLSRFVWLKAISIPCAFAMLNKRVITLGELPMDFNL